MVTQSERLPVILVVQVLLGSVCEGQQTLPLNKSATLDHSQTFMGTNSAPSCIDVVVALCNKAFVQKFQLDNGLLVTYRAHMLWGTDGKADLQQTCLRSQQTCCSSVQAYLNSKQGKYGSPVGLQRSS